MNPVAPDDAGAEETDDADEGRPAGAARRRRLARRPRPDEPPSEEEADDSVSIRCCMSLTRSLTSPPLPLDRLVFFDADLGTDFAAALKMDFLPWDLPAVDWVVEALESEVDVDVVN